MSAMELPARDFLLPMSAMELPASATELPTSGMTFLSTEILGYLTPPARAAAAVAFLSHRTGRSGSGGRVGDRAAMRMEASSRDGRRSRDLCAQGKVGRTSHRIWL